MRRKRRCLWVHSFYCNPPRKDRACFACTARRVDRFAIPRFFLCFLEVRPKQVRLRVLIWRFLNCFRPFRSGI